MTVDRNIAAHTAQEWPDTPSLSGCCYGAAVYGPGRCTCWVPVLEYAQEPMRATDPTPTMPARCSDCAFRRDSPERSGHEQAGADEDDLDELVASGRPFYCHDGMQRPAGWVHPPSLTVIGPRPGDELAWQATYADGPHGRRPHRADGRPAALCAGWASRRAAHLRATGEAP